LYGGDLNEVVSIKKQTELLNYLYNELGKRGEELAVNYLQKKRATICRLIIFIKSRDRYHIQKKVYLQVEVKTCSSTDFGLPARFCKAQKKFSC
jgi:Holliday junction resolvase-like predicted endonuclease